MQFKKIFIILLIFLSFPKTIAQKLELGKVSIAELEEKTHPKDPSAVAAILFNKGEVRFDYNQSEGFVMMTEVKTRIKIYTKEGFDWANQRVKYYLGSNYKESVYFSDAITYNLVGGKIEKTKLKTDGEFDEKVNRNWGQKKITMPNVKEGSVIEFSYTIKSPSIGSLKEWYFQTTIPVNYSEYKTYIPEYFIYNQNQKGFVFPKVTVEKNVKSFIIENKKRSGDLISKTTFSTEKIDYQETKTTYFSENLPSIKEESYVNNIDNYTSSISQELSIIKYPNQPYKTYSTDWETVAKKIYENDDFGPELNKTGYFEDNINVLMKESKTKDELIASIFDFVKSNVKWNNSFGYSCDDGVRKAYKDKTGNAAEINIMLTAMLRYAGITANPVLVSTRSNGIALFPSRNAFNYVITAVESPKGLVLLDATENFSTPNILPLRDLNWFGRLIREDGSSVQVDLVPKSLSKEAVILNVILKNDGSIEGKVKHQLTDHLALNFRKKIVGINNDIYLEELENKNNYIEISDYIRENELEMSNPIIETYSFKSTKNVEIINDKMYVSPMFFFTDTENPFKQEIREYPVDFGYPNESKYYINIEIPEGYAVESIPKGLNAITGDDVGAFKYNINNIGNRIQITIITNIYTAIVPSDFYEILKDFYQKMIDKQNEKIVLKKV